MRVPTRPSTSCSVSNFVETEVPTGRARLPMARRAARSSTYHLWACSSPRGRRYRRERTRSEETDVEVRNRPVAGRIARLERENARQDGRLGHAEPVLHDRAVDVANVRRAVRV